jgi:hypothetical protein
MIGIGAYGQYRFLTDWKKADLNFECVGRKPLQMHLFVI